LRSGVFNFAAHCMHLNEFGKRGRINALPDSKSTKTELVSKQRARYECVANVNCKQFMSQTFHKNLERYQAHLEKFSPAH